jgi:malonyl CoA-acyl carrier protein transacylase
MSKSALLFPGQGSQDGAMRELAREHFPELISQAVDALGADPFERIDEGTAYLQPAVYCGTLAHWRATGEPLADFAAGHSLGELAALTAAGCMSPSEGMHLVLIRAIAMQRAAEAAEAGGLIAVTGPRARAWKLARRHGLTVAADNSPEQIVLAGLLVDLQAARREARPCGLRAVRLRVPAALHSSAMHSAIPLFREALAATSLAAPRMTVIANVTAAPFEDVPSELALALISRVRWRETVLALDALGVRRFREMSGSGILSALVEHTLPAA